MSPFAQTLLTNLIVIVFAMVALWLVGTVRRDASIVDPFWGTGFVIVAWVAWFINSPAALRVLILAILTTVWGLRLSLFLLWRNAGTRRRPPLRRDANSSWPSILVGEPLYRISAASSDSLVCVASDPMRRGPEFDLFRPAGLTRPGSLFGVSAYSSRPSATGNLRGSKWTQATLGELWTTAYGDTHGTPITLATSAFGGGSI